MATSDRKLTKPSGNHNARTGRSDISQTLARGLEVLQLLSQQPSGMSTSEIAGKLYIHRTIVYRLLRTLETYDLVTGTDNRRDRVYVLGVGVTRLAQAVKSGLRSVARPIMEELVAAAGATANLAVAEGDEAVVLVVLEPRHADMHITYRAGQRHSLDRGSAGLAILAGRPPKGGERDEVTTARARGYAVSLGEVIPGVIGVSAPISRPGGELVEASVGVSVFTEADVDRVVEHVVAAAAEISRRLV